MKTDTNYTTAPFDLAKALAGHPLVTRDGRDVSGFRHRPDGAVTFKFSAEIGNHNTTFRDDGSWDITESHNDLFLKIEAPAEPDYTCPRYRAGVMLAFADGAEIEWRYAGNDKDTWEPVLGPTWDFPEFDYRVAPPKPAKPRLIGYYVMQEKKTLPMIELTPEVIAALESAGVPFEKGGDQ